MIGFPTDIWTRSLSTIHFKLKILIKKAVFFEHLLYLFIVRTKINNIKEDVLMAPYCCISHKQKQRNSQIK